ncbi:MAG TPA: hypothetical protein VNG51_18430 [Ktedonobacteraceae bacterium]|nr:hypothetical protein [Ktedonobacteraceae bacterium]
MELSLRLDTLGLVEMRYLRSRDRYRDWPVFLLHAASRQARVMAYLNRDVAEQLHQQILLVETTVGIDEDDDDDDEELDDDKAEHKDEMRSAEREGSNFSPALAQALDQLNKLARQRLPDGSPTASSELPPVSGGVPAETELTEGEEEDALEQLQDAFVQMMEVVRELAEELSTDALKLTGRFRCARTNIEFIQAEIEDDDDESDDDTIHIRDADGGVEVEMEVELVMVLQLFEEGRSRPDDLPAVELQLDVDDFERLHETLDAALEYERKSHRRK